MMTMAEKLDKVKVLSANCRGLKDKSKRYDVLNYFKNMEADIICLQDTHLTEQDVSEVKMMWDCDFLLHGIHSNARGVAIFFSNKFEYKILNKYTYEEGNVLIIDIEIRDMKLKIVNIYGPNNDDPTFYSTLTEQFQSSEYDYLIWCGDLIQH